MKYNEDDHSDAEKPKSEHNRLLSQAENNLQSWLPLSIKHLAKF